MQNTDQPAAAAAVELFIGFHLVNACVYGRLIYFQSILTLNNRATQTRVRRAPFCGEVFFAVLEHVHVYYVCGSFGRVTFLFAPLFGASCTSWQPGQVIFCQFVSSLFPSPFSTRSTFPGSNYEKPRLKGNW